VPDREQQVLDRIDRARRRRPKVREERITMSHGAGGKSTHTLIEAIFLDAFRNPLLEPLEDAASLAVAPRRSRSHTDSYVVSPLFFPGGDIGELAINGHVNDLASAGQAAVPVGRLHLEEGFPVADLTRIAGPCGRRGRGGVQSSPVTRRSFSVARPTAVTSTRGRRCARPRRRPRVAYAQPGDAIIVSGPIGDHGVTIMAGPRELDIEADVQSDTAR